MKTKTLVRVALCGAGAMGVWPTLARAGTISVTNTNDVGAGSLRAAIESANAQAGDDTIDLSQVKGTIEIASALPNLSTNISINGPGASVLKIQRKIGASVPKFRLFTVDNGTDKGPTVSVSGVKFFNGLVPTTKEEMKDGNIYSFEGGGGAILSKSSTLTVRRCEFTNNTAWDGGGLYCHDGKADIYESTFTANNVLRSGGGLYLGIGIFRVEGCTFSHNSAGTEGHYNESSGGGLFSGGGTDTTTLSVVNSTFSGNVAGEGGGLFNGARSILLANSTFTDNSAMLLRGGGVYMQIRYVEQKYRIGSCIIAGNPKGDDIYIKEYYNYAGMEPSSLGYNLIGTGLLAGHFNLPTDQILVANPRLGTLKDNGGPTQTHLPMIASPAIDKGHWFGEGPSSVDQRGGIRTQLFLNSSKPHDGDGTDIGAIEVVPPTLLQIAPITPKFPPVIHLPKTPIIPPGK